MQVHVRIRQPSKTAQIVPSFRVTMATNGDPARFSRANQSVRKAGVPFGRRKPDSLLVTDSLIDERRHIAGVFYGGAGL
jgi:hypothetical protein